jgi:oxygen-dependent protoporphyrinogen oxidase
VRRSGSAFQIDVAGADHSYVLDAEAVVLAVPGNAVVPMAGDLLTPEHEAFLSSVEYASHHIARFLVAGPTDGFPGKALLPTAEGFRMVGKVTFDPLANGRLIVTVDIKDSYARTVVPGNVVRAFPQLRGHAIEDFVMTRNDVGLCRRPAGFVRRLAAFKALPLIPGLALAGDYLLNSTVGAAHRTGLDAAEATLAVVREPATTRW